MADAVNISKSVAKSRSGDNGPSRRRWVVSVLGLAWVAFVGFTAGCAGPKGGPRRRIRRRTRRRMAAWVAVRGGRRVLVVTERPAVADVVVIDGRDAAVAAVTSSHVTLTNADGTQVSYEFEVGGG